MFGWIGWYGFEWLFLEQMSTPSSGWRRVNLVTLNKSIGILPTCRQNRAHVPAPIGRFFERVFVLEVWKRSLNDAWNRTRLVVLRKERKYTLLHLFVVSVFYISSSLLKISQNVIEKVNSSGDVVRHCCYWDTFFSGVDDLISTREEKHVSVPVIWFSRAVKLMDLYKYWQRLTTSHTVEEIRVVHMVW